MTSPPSKIDVHHHVAPPEYVSDLAGRGITEVGEGPSTPGARRSTSP